MKTHVPVTVITPIYKTEEYIERCAISLFEQDFKEIEYIFIDDASPDRSIEILQEVLECYPQRKSHTRILTNPKNLGLYQTRKRGLYEAKGEYVLHADSDDWMEPDMVSSLYQKAQEGSADIATCDVLIEKPSCVQYHEQSAYVQKRDLLYAMAHARNRVSVWNKLVRKSCYEKVYETQEIHRDLNVGEDWIITIPLFFSTQNVVHIHQPLYHYNCKNSESLTAKPLREKFFEDQLLVNNFIYSFLDKHGENYSKVFKSFIALPNLWQNFCHGHPVKLHELQRFDTSFIGLWRETCLSFFAKCVFTLYLLKVPGLIKVAQKILCSHLPHQEREV